MKLKLFQQNPTVEKYKPDSALRQIESLDIDRKEDLERFRAWMEGAAKEKSELPDQGELDELNKQATSGRGISLGLLGVMAAIPLAGLALGGGLTGLSKIANDAMSAITGGGGKPGAGAGNDNLLGIDTQDKPGATNPKQKFPRLPGLPGGGGKLSPKVNPTTPKSSRPASSTPRSNAAGNQVSPGQQSRTNSNRATKPGQTSKGVTQPRKPSPLKGFKAKLETGTAFGGKGSGLQKRFHKLFSGKNPLQGFIKKIFGTKVGRKAIGSVLGKAVRRIPILGAVIGTLMDIFLGGEKVGRAIFKGVGAGMFGALGAAIGGPFALFTGIGGMAIGEWAGGMLYDKIFGGGGAKVIPKATDETEEQIIFGKEELETLKKQQQGQQRGQQQGQQGQQQQFTVPTSEIPAEGSSEEEWAAHFRRLDAMSGQQTSNQSSSQTAGQPLRGSVSSGGNGPLVDVISQKAMKDNYGVPTGPVRTRGRGSGHGGVDIGTGSQTGYYVAYRSSGTVSLVRSLSGYGNTVIINIGNLDFLFAHLARKSDLKPGQSYNGEIIGEIGNTGRSFGGGGQHLHFEVRPAGGGGGSDVDPEPYVSALVIGRLDPNSEKSRVGGVQSGEEMPNAPGQVETPQQTRQQPGIVQQMTKMLEPMMPIIKLFEYMSDKELMDKTVIYGRDPETGLPIPNFKPVKPAPVKQDMVSVFTQAAEMAQGDVVIIQGGQTVVPSGGSESAPSPNIHASGGSGRTVFVGGGFSFPDTYRGMMATKLKNN